MMRMAVSFMILGVLLAWQGRADYVLNLSSEGATSREVFAGTRVSLAASLQAQSGETHNAAIFRLEFSAPGLVYESYDWPFPYDNETLSDDSKPLFRQLPLSLNADTLNGVGYPDGVVDIELSNAVDSIDRFGAGALVEMSFRIPDNHPLGPLTVTPVVDAISDGFNLISTQAGAAVQFNVVAKPTQFNTAPILSVIPDQSLDEDSSILGLLFDASDNEQLPQQLSVSAISSNQSRVRNANISISGSGNQRFMSITPEPNFFGSVNITVSVSDGLLTTQRAFTLTIINVNDPPGIGNIAAQSLQEDQSLNLPLNLFDIDHPISGLNVAAIADNANLFPEGSMTYLSSPSPTLRLTPAPNQFGQALIEVTVSDGADDAARTFSVSVLAVNDPPALTGLQDLVLEEDQTGRVEFQLSDPDTPIGDLSLTFSQNNSTLFPEANVRLGGNGASRFLELTPQTNLGGSAQLTVTVSDGTLQSQGTFVVTVNAADTPPEISGIESLTTLEDTPVEAAFRIHDDETALEDLGVIVESLSPALVSSDGIEWTRAGNEIQVNIVPVPNAAGEGSIRLVVSDGNLNTSLSVPIVIVAVNDPPTLQALPDQTMRSNGFLILPITLGDVDHDAQTLELSVQSSNPSVVANANFVISGEGTIRNLNLTPVRGSSGIAGITITVSDPEGAQASVQFNVAVERANIAAAPEFIAWKAELNLPEGQDEPEDDADGDGIPNVVEFVFRTPPLESNNAGLPKSVALREGETVFPGVTFTRNRLAFGIAIEVKAFTALGQGEPVELVEVVEILDDRTERVTLQPANPSPTTAMFFIAVVRVQ